MKQLKEFDLLECLTAMGIPNAAKMVEEAEESALRQEEDSRSNERILTHDLDKVEVVLHVYLDDTNPPKLSIAVADTISGYGYCLSFWPNDCRLSSPMVLDPDAGICAAPESIAALIYAEAERDVAVACVLKKGLTPFFG